MGAKLNQATDEALVDCVRGIENLLIKQSEGRVYRSLISMVERPMIEQALFWTEGNKLRAARILGINRNTLHSKIKKLRIDAKKFKRTPR